MGFFDWLRQPPTPPTGPVDGVIETFSFASDGVIALDDGRRVAFSVDACLPEVALVTGTEVRVTVDASRGEPRATRVEPRATETVEQRVWPEVGEETGFERRYGPDGLPRSVQIRRAPFDRDAVLARHPTWHPASDFADNALAAHDPAQWPDLDVTPLPFFEPWHEGIRAAAARVVHLMPAEEGPTVATFGGLAGPTGRPWPECPTHGPMVTLLCVEPAAFDGLLSSPRRLVVHACPPCVRNARDGMLAEGHATGSIEWALGEGAASPPDRATSIPEISLTRELALDFPPSWLSRPRRDVEGHEPLTGVSAELFEATLRMRRREDAPFHYEPASTAYDLHYRPSFGGVILGGFTDELVHCPTCHRPLLPLFRLIDYMSEDRAMAELFEGSTELTLLFCDRSDGCGGPERGELLLFP